MSTGNYGENAELELKFICACPAKPDDCPNEVDHLGDLCKPCLAGFHPHLRVEASE